MNNNENLINLQDLNLSDEELFSRVDNSSIESEKITAPRYSYWKSVFRVFFKKKINTVILAILAFIIIFTYVYPLFAGYDRFENLNTEGGKHLTPEKAIVKYIYNADPEKYTVKEAKARYFDNRDELTKRLTDFLELDENCSSKELSAAISQSADKFLHDLYINKTVTEAYSEYLPCGTTPEQLASALINFINKNDAEEISAAVDEYTADYNTNVYGVMTLQAVNEAYSAANAGAQLSKIITDKYASYFADSQSSDDEKKTTDQEDFVKYFETVDKEQMTAAIVAQLMEENGGVTLNDCQSSESPVIAAVAGYLMNSDNAKTLALTQYFGTEEASRTLADITDDASASKLSAALAGFLTGSSSDESSEAALSKIFSGNIASMTLDECIASGDTLPGTFAKFYTEYYYGKIAFIDVCADFLGCTDSKTKTVATEMVKFFTTTAGEELKAEYVNYTNSFVSDTLPGKKLSFAVSAALGTVTNEVAAQNLITSLSLDESTKAQLEAFKSDFFTNTYSSKTIGEAYTDSFTDFSIAEEDRAEVSTHDLALKIATKFNNTDFSGDGQINGCEYSVTDPEQMVETISDILSTRLSDALAGEGLAHELANAISKDNIVAVMAVKSLLDENSDKKVAECLASDGLLKSITEIITAEKNYGLLAVTNIIDGDAGQVTFLECKSGTGVSSLAKAFANTVENQSFYNKKTLATASADFMCCPIYADKLTEAFSRMLFSSSIARGFEIIHWILGAGASGESTFDAIWYGSEISISLALICAAINMTVGVVIGAVWGFSKSVDVVMTEVYNIIGNVPYILFISVMVLIFSPSFWTMVFALTITGWLGIAYFIRTQVIIIRDREYNLASRCLGTPILRLTVKNILPFMTSVIVTLIATEIPSYISYEVFLSYIGMGMSSNGPLSLGKLIYNAEPSMLVPAWSLEFWSPVVIASIITVVLYVVGQNLGDASDPRTHM